MRSLFVPVARLRNHNPLPVVYLLFTQQSIRNVCRFGGTARTNALQGTDASMGSRNAHGSEAELESVPAGAAKMGLCSTLYATCVGSTCLCHNEEPSFHVMQNM